MEARDAPSRAFDLPGARPDRDPAAILVSPMSRTARSMAAAVLLVLLSPASAYAHGDAGPLIHVIAERVMQGETFTVLASDLDPTALVSFEIIAAGQSFPVGQAISQPDGHFTETFVMPSSTPDGYAELWARSEAGSQAMMWLLVGDAPATGAPGPPTGTRGTAGPPWPVIALGIGWVVGLTAIGVVLWRSRRRGPADAASDGEVAPDG